MLIAAVARNGVIGAEGGIPWHLPADFAHFKSTTLGHTLVMGRATYDSIGRPLPGRTTIVLTRDPSWSAEGVLVADSLPAALALAADLPGDVFVAGGAQVYAEALPLADEQVISEVDAEPAGDAFYPAFDPGVWREVSREPHEGFTVVRRERVTPRPIEVVAWSASWSVLFAGLADDLRAALADIPGARVEHVGSTSVPGLAAKPVLDVDIVVDRAHVAAAVAALAAVGYVHRGDLGVTGRQAFLAPDTAPRRHVYICESGTLNLRNHLAVRDVLRRRPDLRHEYAAVKLALAADPAMDIDAYLAGKTAVLQKVLAESDLTTEELAQIRGLNDPAG